MTTNRAAVIGLAVLALNGAPQAQQAPTKTEKVQGTSQVETLKLTGEVVWVDGNWLLARMQPLGNYSLFNVQPGREFVIDGQKKRIGDLKPGTVLNGTMSKRTTAVTMRTTSTLSGTVRWVQGNYVIVTLDSGENKEYTVPESYQFNVSGKPATVKELRQGMKISATKIVEEPRTEISTDTVITGKAPK
jgi:hypothetical protein